MTEQDKIRFEAWLTKRGAIVLPPTNQWELIRYKTVDTVSIVYTNKNKALTFTGDSDVAYKAWRTNRHWTAIKRKRQPLRSKKAVLATRDGKRCFACLDKLGYDKLTIEHILSFCHGGTDNDNNLCLLCVPCNNLMDSLPIVKKIELIISIRNKHQHTSTLLSTWADDHDETMQAVSRVLQ